MTRIAVFADSETGLACLEFLIRRGETVVFVGTPGGGARVFSDVVNLARSKGLEPVVGPPSDPVAIERLRAAAPDLLFSFSYRAVLPEEVLLLPRLGAFSVHESLLPKYRGPSAVNWAVAKGETRTGATLHFLTREPDAGDIVDQREVSIGPDDTAIEVERHVAAAAVEILEERIAAIQAGTAPRRPQPDSQVTAYPMWRPQDGRIDWTKSAQDVHDLVRAVTHPYPGAFTDVFGSKTFLWKTSLPHLGAHDNFPGQVRAEEGKLYVACGDDRYVEILRLQREGEDETDAAQYLASVGSVGGF